MTRGKPESPNLADWPVAILAGGLATRLRPRTSTIPKALLEVAERPFVGHQLALLHKAGFRRAVLCLGYLGEQIEAFLGDGTDYEMSLAYSFDGDRLRGTGGALKRALSLLGERFVVLYGDSYLPIDYKAVVAAFLREDKPALMTVFKNDGHWDRSNVLFESGRIRCYNKTMPTPDMHYIEYGLGVLAKDAFGSFLDQEVFDLADVYRQLVESGQMAAFEVKERFYEIGSREGLDELDALLRDQSVTS
ncbi:MAG: nucleotidyltransferase family protein [Chthoniobacterales bacterium]